MLSPSPWVRIVDRLTDAQVRNFTGTFIPGDFIEDIITRNTVLEVLESIETAKKYPRDIIVRAVLGQKELFAAILMGHKPDQIEALLDSSSFNRDLPFDQASFCALVKGNLLGDQQSRTLYTHLRNVRGWILKYQDIVHLDRTDVTLPFLKIDQMLDHGHQSALARITITKDHLDEEIWKHPIVKGPRSLRRGVYGTLKSLERITVVQKSIVIFDKNSKEYEEALSEYRTLISISHECVVTLLSAYTHGDKFYMLFPMYDATLAKFLKSPPDDWDVCVYIRAFSGLCEGLRYIHDEIDKLGTVYTITGSHNDLKPDNIMVDEKGRRFVIIDLGFATVRKPSEGPSNEFSSGKHPYLAPEAFHGVGSTNFHQPQDIWALGCILLEVLMSIGHHLEIHGWNVSVAEFKKRRSKSVPRQQSSGYFFESDAVGKVVLNFVVAGALKELTSHSEQWAQKLAGILRGMLEVRLDDRMDARTVASGFAKLETRDTLPNAALRSQTVQQSAPPAPPAPPSRPAQRLTDGVTSKSDEFGHDENTHGLEHVESRFRETALAFGDFEAFQARTKVQFQWLLSRINEFEKPERKRFIATFEATELGQWARSDKSRILLAYNNRLDVSWLQNILSCVLARVICSATSNGVLTVFHFCDNDSNSQTVADDLVKQLLCQWPKAPKPSRMAQSSQDCDPNVYTMSDFIQLHSALPSSSKLVVILDRVDICETHGKPQYDHIDAVVTLLVQAVTEAQGHLLETHATLKLLLTVVDDRAQDEARKWWKITAADSLCNYKSDRGEDDTEAMSHSFGGDSELQWS